MNRIEITETGRNSLKGESSTFNREVKTVATVEEVKAYLIDRYGKMPKGKNKIYIDTQDGETIETGFTYSFWNQDVSHNSPKWYQTDWISFDIVNFEPFDIKQLY
ncbi:MAG: hypothetical protein WC476_11705 [Phycisphaerae bacterium]|jgi:hypothetical protein